MLWVDYSDYYYAIWARLQALGAEAFTLTLLFYCCGGHEYASDDDVTSMADFKHRLKGSDGIASSGSNFSSTGASGLVVHAVRVYLLATASFRTPSLSFL